MDLGKNRGILLLLALALRAGSQGSSYLLSIIDTFQYFINWFDQLNSGCILLM